MKLGVIFGGMSTEHDVSVVSATSILTNLNKNKYEIYPIYISKEGLFYKYDVKEYKVLELGEEITNITLIDNIVEYLKKLDVVFPVLHGLYGEDGTIQGLLELINVPYVGCHVLASSLCMDKVYTKVVLRQSSILVAKSMYIKRYKDNYIYIDNEFNRFILNSEELINKVNDYIHFPLFVKPSNSGSSVGVYKVLTKDDFIEKLECAFKYDSKVLVEECINGREVECAILGNEDLTVSSVGEILISSNFYSYDSKYKDNSSKTIILNDIDKELQDNIQTIAKKAYLACDCKGLARVDFFIENITNRIILNEINTLPGFTSISMYPKLMENRGISYSNILDKLIELALVGK